jgi:hypothetical protein
MKKQTIFQFPLSFSLVQSLFAQTVAIAILIAVNPDNHQRRTQPALSPPSRPQRRQRQWQFFTILQTSSGGCAQMISNTLRSSTTSMSH